MKVSTKDICSTPAPTAQLLQMKNYVECRVAKVAIEICTRAKEREVSGMVSKGRRIKFW